ncbi:energy-coupling factor transporter transmembrane component T family protein [Oenococcus kitaharae]|uniref:ECF transporter transmembrane component n=1 Tax=Oenococcus kitaharae DSM 17330 TaxID=1045004 RepID=G9WIL5_9LACO|nr:energy-coupling factor transporter transmembrane component T [Oenococcus kitaharae]EHN58154.1 ECF transporter transmembrane component [Oenococcus kitaharae DSM 17330]OEY81641.1 cobalt ABC transporter ATP-binding protein [Oenococcus kitaharae]OEY83126.1 cobalt ABC transporter ATP-binding protein [Oenococcus kitaharae]OEY84328.1 cobalt ABC transporter ATP-binding protein [Oenococcus kitaharae]
MNLDRLLIGRYLPGSTVIHKLDARVKLVITLAFIALTFFADNWQSSLLLFLFIFIAVAMAKINLLIFLKGIQPMLWLIIFTVLMQVLFLTGGRVYWHWGWLIISEYGFASGILIFFRFVLIIFISTLLTLTTSPTTLADGIASLLSPLKIFHLPIDEIAFMLALSLRFVPTLMDETSKIMTAQRSRGVDFGQGNVFQQMKAVIPIFIPQFIASFHRADELATAMASRGYRPAASRTKLYRPQLKKRDGFAILAFALLTYLTFILSSK